MSILAVEVEPIAVDVSFTDHSMTVRLADGREITVPLEWSSLLRNAAPVERNKWRLIGGGVGIHWEDIDEDISIASLLRIK
ncbi:MAG: DUF2442 domain-containing protein [Pyrinomonadaceae bacterium]